MFWLVQLLRKHECSLPERQLEQGSHIIRESCLPKAEQPCLLIANGSLRSTTKIHGTAAWLFAFTLSHRKEYGLILYLFFRKTSCRKCPLRAVPQFHSPQGSPYSKWLCLRPVCSGASVPGPGPISITMLLTAVSVGEETVLQTATLSF